MMLLAWLAGVGTGVSVTVLVYAYREQVRARYAQQIRRAIWAEPLRLFTQEH